MLHLIRSKKRPAAASVEFAVLLPFLLFVIFMAVDYARIFYHVISLTNAARNGAVYASAHPDNVSQIEKIKAIVLADTQNLSPAPFVTTQTLLDDSGNNVVEVTVNWEFPTIINYPGIPNRVNIERKVQMRVAPAFPRDGEFASDS